MRGLCYWAALVVLSACADHTVVVPLATPAGANSSSPNISADVTGQPVLSWQRRQQDVTILEYSTLSKNGWSEPVEVARGRDWFVNWADVPAVQPVTDSFWAAHYLQRTPGGKYAYDIRLRLSDDGGKNWRDAGSPHLDGTPTEHGFVSLYANDDTLGIIWLDGREMSTHGDAQPHNTTHHGGMTLRAASMDHQGRFAHRRQVDALVCDCCQTAAVMTQDNPLVVYRDRTETELRDIASSSWQQGAWTAPKPVGADGWQINGCPVNGPALVARQNDVAAVWFSGAGGESQIFLSRSSDGGATFEDKLKVNIRKTLGRVTAVMYPDRSILVAWLRQDDSETAKIVARYIGSDNNLSPIFELVSVSPERLSGFPKLALLGTQAVLAWTDQSRAKPQVSTLMVDVDAVN